MVLRSKKNRKSYFINTGATTSRHRCASDDNIHGQEMFKTMIQFPNHQAQCATADHINSVSRIFLNIFCFKIYIYLHLFTLYTHFVHGIVKGHIMLKNKEGFFYVKYQDVDF